MAPWREEEAMVINGVTVIICPLSGLFQCKKQNKSKNNNNNKCPNFLQKLAVKKITQVPLAITSSVEG